MDLNLLIIRNINSVKKRLKLSERIQKLRDFPEGPKPEYGRGLFNKVLTGSLGEESEMTMNRNHLAIHSKCSAHLCCKRDFEHCINRAVCMDCFH